MTALGAGKRQNKVYLYNYEKILTVNMIQIPDPKYRTHQNTKIFVLWIIKNGC